MRKISASAKREVVIDAVGQRRRQREGAKTAALALPGGLRRVRLMPPAAFRGIARWVSSGVEREADRRL